MNVILIKLTHQIYRLKLIVDNNVLYEKDLENKSFFRHDLMHYLVESSANLKHSFYGSFKYGEIEDKTEIFETEKIVSILQSINKDPHYDPQIYFEKIEQAWSVQDYSIPQYLNTEFIKNIGIEFINILREWESMKTGDTSMLRFEF